MNEQRFELHKEDYFVFDEETEDYLDLEDCCELLNEQQATITELKEENEQLKKELDNFKPIMFKNMQKGTIILYSKGGIDE